MKELSLVNSELKVQVDDQDYEWLSKFIWRLSESKPNKFYIITRHNCRTKYIHRMILKTNQLVDHKDGNFLNNQRDNIRPCDYSQNGANRRLVKTNAASKYKGVSFDKRRNHFIAQIMVRGSHMYLGSYPTEELAALAYNNAAIKHFKEFACINTLIKA